MQIRILTTSRKRRIREIEDAAKTRAMADTVCSMSIDLNLPLSQQSAFFFVNYFFRILFTCPDSIILARA